jgi:hypothetical protein
MNANYFNLLRTAGKAALTHVGLVDDAGAEIGARQAETWTDDGDGVMRLAADRTFAVPAGVTVAGWQGYSADVDGTAYGVNVVPSETFTGAGEYVLAASLTSITHAAG